MASKQLPLSEEATSGGLYFFTVQVLFNKQFILLNRTKINAQRSVMHSNQSNCILYLLEACCKIIHFAILKKKKKNLYVFFFLFAGTQ